MKRFLCILLAFSAALSLAGCTQKHQPKEPVVFYYRTAINQKNFTDSMISSEIRDIYGMSNDFGLIISEYLKGPKSDKCISPFPAGTTLQSADIVSNKAYVVLSVHLSTISGAELMLACSCIAKTILEFSQVRTVEIRASNGLLNGQESITIRAKDFIYYDEFASTGPIINDESVDPTKAP